MKKLIRLLGVALLTLCLCACSGVKRYMTYTVYPIGYLLNRIAGNHVEAVSIQNNNMAQTASVVSDYQDILTDTSVFFHIGDLEPYLDIYGSEIEEKADRVVDLSTLNAIYKFQRYTLVYVDGKESYIETPYYNGDAFKDLDVNDKDLNLWIDPIGMLSMAKDIYGLLSSNYVEQAASFKTNYKALESDLISLDARYQALSQLLKKNNATLKFVTMSASFGNWQKAYGFQVYPVCMSKYGALPSSTELQLIKQRIVADGVEYIAFEPNMSEEMMTLFAQLETELNLKRITLSNLSSLSPTQISDGKDYLSLMYENLNVLEGVAASVIQKNQDENMPSEDDTQEATKQDETIVD